MDELVDILDSKGNKTGKVALKSEAHKKGLFHASVHTWLYTKKGEVLIQQRAASKNVFPNRWDVSVAGHIGAGETPENSAIREVEEEIGLKVTTEDLDKIGLHQSTIIHNKDLIDCEFHHVYLIELTVSISELKIQESEVADIKLIDIDAFLETLKNPLLLKNYVPFPPDYLDMVFSSIRKKIG